jgi:hypothetical protein
MLTRSFQKELGMSDAILTERIVADVVREATVNLELRTRFLNEPKMVLREKGIEFPDSVRITVHEFDVDDRHIFLPPLARLTPPEPIPADLSARRKRRDSRGRPPGAPSNPARFQPDVESVDPKR